jgi:hypothetical protein
MIDIRTEARALLAQITPGEWSVCLGSGNNLCTAVAAITENGMEFVADCLPKWAFDKDTGGDWPKDHTPNMAFIAAAPRLVANLLAHCDALEQEREKGERVFQAVVYAFEGRDVPEDLQTHGMVNRGRNFHAARDATLARLREALDNAAVHCDPCNGTGHYYAGTPMGLVECARCKPWRAALAASASALSG